MNLTVDSKTLYTIMLSEADYENDDENGFNLALMKFTPQQRGNLSDLKKKGLVETWDDPDVPGYLWVEFTDIETAKSINELIKS